MQDLAEGRVNTRAFVARLGAHDDGIPHGHMTKDALETFRGVVGNIDAALPHGFHRERVRLPRLGPRAEDFEGVAGQMAQPTFRHLAAGRVVRAEEKDAGFADHKVSRRLASLQRPAA